MSAPVYEFWMGTSAGTQPTLRTIGVIWPRDEFTQYPVVKDLVSGGQRGMGLPQLEWNWDVIQGDQYAILKAFRSDVTTSGIYVRTRDQDNVFHTYLCDMVWPAKVQWSAGRVLKFRLEFRNLVQQ